MSSERRIATCANCGKEREIAAHGLCFKCYRAAERAAENPWAAADRHDRAKLRAQKKLRTAITAILNAVDGVIEFMDEEHVEIIRGICGHYYLGLASGLPTAPIKTVDGVNSEHETAVNSSLAEAVVDVNSEQKIDVHGSQESSTAELIRPESEGTDRFAEVEGPSCLIKGRRYEVRPHPFGGYGIYEDGSTKCLQRYDDDFEAWEAIVAVTELPEDAVQELLDGS